MIIQINYVVQIVLLWKCVLHCFLVFLFSCFVWAKCIHSNFGTAFKTIERVCGASPRIMSDVACCGFCRIFAGCVAGRVRRAGWSLLCPLSLRVVAPAVLWIDIAPPLDLGQCTVHRECVVTSTAAQIPCKSPQRKLGCIAEQTWGKAAQSLRPAAWKVPRAGKFRHQQDKLSMRYSAAYTADCILIYHSPVRLWMRLCHSFCLTLSKTLQDSPRHFNTHWDFQDSSFKIRLLRQRVYSENSGIVNLFLTIFDFNLYLIQLQEINNLVIWFY